LLVLEIKLHLLFPLVFTTSDKRGAWMNVDDRREQKQHLVFEDDDSWVTATTVDCSRTMAINLLKQTALLGKCFSPPNPSL
jgi:hypothetical protein